MKRNKITRLYELREKNNLTQEEAAALFGVSASYYRQVECGNCRAGRGFIERFKMLYPYESIDFFFEVS